MTSTGGACREMQMPFVPCRSDLTTSFTHSPQRFALGRLPSLCSFLVSFSSASGEEIGLRALSRS